MDQFSQNTILKVDADLGLVFGWAIICKEDGKEYFDLQGDHIPEQSMLEASADFMAKARVGKGMHRGDQIADVVFAFPMTEDIAKSFGFDAPAKTGLMIAWKPHTADILEKFRSGEWTGFSIGGDYVETEEHADA